MRAKGLWVASFGLTLLFVISPSIAQQDSSKPADTTQPAPADSKKKAAAKSDQKRETVAKPLTEKQRKAQEAALKKELETPWKKWLNEDVAYIITDEERKAFKQSQYRRRARTVRRAILAAPRSHPGYRRKRIQRRALPAHRLRQRAFRFRHPGLEDGSRPHLHHIRTARRNRLASLWRHL